MSDHPSVSDCVWGPAYWSSLHAASFLYKPSLKREYRAFIVSMSDVIPCKACKVHFEEWVSTHAGTDSRIFDSWENLSRAFVELHNEIRVLQGKPTRDYESVYREYTTDEKDAQACPLSFTEKIEKNRRLGLFLVILVVVVSSIAVSKTCSKKEK